MDKNFHATVLQRPPGLQDLEDGRRANAVSAAAAVEEERRRHDILNPPRATNGATSTGSIDNSNSQHHPPPPPYGSGGPQLPQAASPPATRTSFHLRSPVQPHLHRPPSSHYNAVSPSSSSIASAAQQQHPYDNRYATNAPTSTTATTTTTGSLPPHYASSAALPPPHSPRGAPPSSLQAPSLRAPPISYHTQDMREPQQPLSPTRAREKVGGSFYDPTTGITTTTTERRTSDASASWRSVPQQSSPSRNHYDQPPILQPPMERNPYSSTYYTSPQQTAMIHDRSPVSHARQPPSITGQSPTRRNSQLVSPRFEHNGIPSTMPPSRSRVSSITSHTSTAAPVLQPPAPPVSETPSRAANMMSFSNILSNAEPEVKPRPATPPAHKAIFKTENAVEENSKKAEPLNKPLTSDANIIEPPSDQPQTKDTSPPRPTLKRQLNGQLKHKGLSVEKEKKIKDCMEKLDLEHTDKNGHVGIEISMWKERSSKRRAAMRDRSISALALQQASFINDSVKILSLHAGLGKRRYSDVHGEKAMEDVKRDEEHAEKERKKDMQRKRRREKSMAATIEHKEQLLAKAEAAEDDEERQKYLKDAERASKKAHQTQLVLEKGTKGPPRNLTPMDLNMDGGSMSTFSATEGEPVKGKKGRGAARPKKSKEQKQAEKDSAAAAQAAIDAGEELPEPPPNKIRLKLKRTLTEVDVDDEMSDASAVPIKAKATDDARFQTKGYIQINDQIWRDLARKDVGKVCRLASESYAIKASNLKKTAILASKEAKKWQARTNKGTKDLQARAKRVMREMLGFWKRNEREERDLRKAAERMELENARKEEADREAARQKRKLNFLISQTELYSHFIGKKIKTDEVERSTDNPELPAEERAAAAVKETEEGGAAPIKVTKIDELTFEEEDEEKLRSVAKANAQLALAETQKKAQDFNKDTELDEEGEMNFRNPTEIGDVDIEQPKMLTVQLKEYQLKGLNWLANLYEQGINGILADEMGLGKTIQSITVMGYLAERHDIWGPFLVVAPSSTLHNWEQELRRFVPELKILPYWGTAGDRKTLRKFWDRRHGTYKKDAAFHVMITSYQLVVSDIAYFQKMKWQYMILDEAQAIKSSNSARWKSLLGLHCRNRLLLTGTPIQNNMQELWSLLHFIMPSLFDSHDEFSEWFSKDIESASQSNTKLNEDQLKRLHMILKPFMLRRMKKHVQKELGDKIELDVYCDLTYRQRAYYGNLRNQISIMDLIEKATIGDDSDSGTLMNLVMQFRKVCNHPDLFERADTSSPFAFSRYAETASFLREGNDVSVAYSTRSTIDYELPRLLWQRDGRLDKAGPRNEKAGFRNKYLNHMMNIWSPDNAKESVEGSGAFSWLRFADTSLEEAYRASQQDVFTRAVRLAAKKKNRLGDFKVMYDHDDEAENQHFTPAHALFQIKDRSDRQPLADITQEGVLRNLMNISRTTYDKMGVSQLEQAARPGAMAAPIDIVCDDPGTELERQRTMFNVPMRRALYGPNPTEERALVTSKIPAENMPMTALVPAPDSERNRFTNIQVPSMRRFVTDSGKLAKLDELLFKLKEGGHRVLLYFQMTRMIDLVEEYLTYRNYRFCRLDGSTKIEDRRDVVEDFKNMPEIFVFLLSTRAGGLGLNLTTADTVIFYDSDWNPTIDSQAMDRAHRLGQTKQVTVYRLITRGTIEERIRKRALQKEEVQRVVISGGGAAGSGGVDFSGRRAPENRNKDIAMWLADDDDAVEKMISQREQELLASGEYDKQAKKKGGAGGGGGSGGGGSKKKKVGGGDAGASSMAEMYHEGEPNMAPMSGADTPTTGGGGGGGGEGDSGAAGKKGKKKGTGKKAKTAKQRLAIADGEIDA